MTDNREYPLEPEGRGATVVQRVFRAIEALADGPRSASEVSRVLDVNRSTALRLLGELEATGYVARDPATKRYHAVSARFYRLIAEGDDRADWREVVDPLLAELRDEFGEAAIVGLPANGAMVYMAYFSSAHMVTIRERLGTIRPMHCSALGKAYLSGLDPSALDEELGRLTYVGGTAKAPQGPLELRERVDEARRRGHAIDRDETFDGGSCIAAPMFISGSLVGAIGVSGPSTRFTERRFEDIGARLREITGRLHRG